MLKQLLLVALLAWEGVRAWPEGQPNCFLEGEWTDPQGLEIMKMEKQEFPQQGMKQVLLLSYNTTKHQMMGATQLRDPRVAAVEVRQMKKRKRAALWGREEDIMLALACQNEALWVLQIPLDKSTLDMRVFTLHRQKTYLAEEPIRPTPEVDSSRNIVINITLPQPSNHHQEDAVNSMPSDNDDAIDELSEDEQSQSGADDENNGNDTEEEESTYDAEEGDSSSDTDREEGESSQQDESDEDEYLWIDRDPMYWTGIEDDECGDAEYDIDEDNDYPFLKEFEVNAEKFIDA